MISRFVRGNHIISRLVGFHNDLYPAIAKIGFDTFDKIWPDFVSLDMKNDRFHHYFFQIYPKCGRV